MRRKASLTFLVIAIEAAILVGFGLLVGSLGLSHDTGFLVAMIGGIIIGWPAGPALVFIWIDA